MTSRLPTNKELGIKPTKKDHALADEIVLSGRMKTGYDFERECLTAPPKVEASLEPFSANPRHLVLCDSDGRKCLRFVVGEGGGQKCSECWFEWFDTRLCQEAPCNSQGRTDGLVGTWQELERSAR